MKSCSFDILLFCRCQGPVLTEVIYFIIFYSDYLSFFNYCFTASFHDFYEKFPTWTIYKIDTYIHHPQSFSFYYSWPCGALFFFISILNYIIILLHSVVSCLSLSLSYFFHFSFLCFFLFLWMFSLIQSLSLLSVSFISSLSCLYLLFLFYLSLFSLLYLGAFFHLFLSFIFYSLSLFLLFYLFTIPLLCSPVLSSVSNHSFPSYSSQANKKASNSIIVNQSSMHNKHKMLAV